MEAYSDFAGVYDLFMEDTPYIEWYEFIKAYLDEHHIKIESVCELGCGTGQMTQLFSKDNYEVIGIDYSADMLMIAQDRAYAENLDILYLMQDMSQFELNQKVDLICSCCDSINYLLEEEEILSTFKQVYEYLEDEGVFIFDMNTLYKYKEVLGNQTFADQTEEAAYIWQNYYDVEDCINEYEVHFFIKDKTGKYNRSVENHFQRGYTRECIEKLLKEAHLEAVALYDNYHFKDIEGNTERITYIARKCRNEK